MYDICVIDSYVLDVCWQMRILLAFIVVVILIIIIGKSLIGLIFRFLLFIFCLCKLLCIYSLSQKILLIYS